MPKRSSKVPSDLNKLAKYIADVTTGQTPQPAPPKNPAAVALGKLGGAKGGPARAAKLSKDRLKAIAKKAAAARWAKKRPTP